MSGYRLGDPDQKPSPWDEHIDVQHNLARENRDPRLIMLQSLWVSLEQYKREKADGDAETAAEILEDARTKYEAIVAKHDYLPPDLRARLNTLKRELDKLLAQ